MKPGIFSQKRVFPTAKAAGPCSQLLSILDATTARFTPSGALWLYDVTPGHDAREPALFASLETSLKSVLSSYQHWAGRLRWARRSDVPGWQRHAGRIVIEWGSPDDPGVDLALGYSERRLEEIVPDQAVRRTNRNTWDATSFPQTELLNPERLALLDFQDVEILPAATVQLTAFACGGYSIAVHVAHPLADAQALAVFVHQWAAHNQAVQGHEQVLEQLDTPIFEPNLLDRHASPVSSGPALEEKSKLSRSLPLHRFDWWGIEDQGYPEWALKSTKTNMAMLPSDSLPLSAAVPGPWSSWNVAAPVKHVFFRFSAAMTARLRTIARSTEDARQDVSRLDAILAHVWLLINEARTRDLESLSGLGEEAKVHLNLTLGARTRVEPRLPDTFVGSPVFLMHVSDSLSNLTKTTTLADRLSGVASLIRSEMSVFTAEAVQAMLHDAAHEEIPQRLWGAFLGTLHVLATSWTRLDAYKVDFWGEGEQRPPRLVQAVMPPCDGLLQVMETDIEGEMDVGLCLEAEAMDRLISGAKVYDF